MFLCILIPILKTTKKTGNERLWSFAYVRIDVACIHVSAGSGHVEVVCLLLDNGADLSAVDNEGRTPFACAKLFGHKQVEQCLKDRKTLT